MGAKLGSWLTLMTILGSRPLWSQKAAAVARCGEADVTARLASLHPLGSAATERAQCLDSTVRWAPVRPLSTAQRRAWADAIDSLWAIQLPECWAGAAVLVNLDQNDLVRTWASVDTAAGKLYVGAAYLSSRAEPLAVQFWARVFDRPLPQLIAVLLHEAYHVISPSASESEASAFGRPCSSTPSSGPTRIGPRQLERSMGKDAKAMEILRKNGLSAKDYVVGVRALRMAFIAPTSGSKMDAVDGIGRRTTPSQV